MGGWQYGVNNVWHDDDTLTVAGKYNSGLIFISLQFFSFTEGEPTYPKMLSLNSTGEAGEKYPDSLGEYQLLQNISHNGHPVYLFE